MTTPCPDAADSASPAAGGAHPARAASELFFGWWVVGGAFLIYFVSGGIFNTAPVFFKALGAEFGWERGALSGAFSLGFVVAGLAAPLWGRIADRRGARSSFLPGVLITGVLCLLLSRVDGLFSLYLLYVAFSFGSAGISLIPISVILSKWFEAKRGRAIGIAYTGVGFGGLAFTPAAGFLVERVGWRATYAIAGLIVLAVLTPVALWMRNRPEDVGMLPDGREPARAQAGVASAAAGTSAAGLSLAEAVRTPVFWLVAVTWTVAMMPLMAVGLHQVAYLTDLGFATESAALAAGGVGGMSILGRVGFGLLAERWAIARLYASCYALYGVGIALLWLTSSVGAGALVPYVVCCGVATGGSWALSALLVGELFGVRALGEIFGLLGLGATLGGAIGGIGAGLLFDRLGSYESVFWLGIALSWLGALAILFARPLRARPRPPRDALA